MAVALSCVADSAVPTFIVAGAFQVMTGVPCTTVSVPVVLAAV